MLGIVVVLAIAIVASTTGLDRVKRMVFSYTPPPIEDWNSVSYPAVSMSVKMPRSLGGQAEDAIRMSDPPGVYRVSQYGDRLYLGVLTYMKSELADLDFSIEEDCDRARRFTLNRRSSSPNNRSFEATELFAIPVLAEESSVYGFDFVAREGPYTIHGRTILANHRALDLQYWTLERDDDAEAQKFLTSVRRVEE